MKTQRDLIKEACKTKNITVKKMCEDINLNYKTYRSKIAYFKLTGKKCLLISEYLDIDLKTLMTAPLDKPIKSKKKDEAK